MIYAVIICETQVTSGSKSTWELYSVKKCDCGKFLEPIFLKGFFEKSEVMAHATTAAAAISTAQNRQVPSIFWETEWNKRQEAMRD